MPETALPKAIFLDWDGTLVNTVPMIRKAHDHVRKKFDMPPWTDKEFQKNMSQSSRDLYPRVYGDRAEEAMEILYAFFADNHLAALETMPGAESLVETIAELDLAAGIISNKRHDYLLKEIDYLGWSHIFENAVGAGHAPRDKPRADALLLGLERGRVRSHETDVWYVGDTETDMKTARNARCAPVLVAAGKTKEELEAKYSPFLSFTNCKGLQDHLNTLKSSV